MGSRTGRGRGISRRTSTTGRSARSGRLAVTGAPFPSARCPEARGFPACISTRAATPIPSRRYHGLFRRTRDAGRHPRHGCSAGSCSPADDTGIAEPHHLGRRESPTRRAPPPYPPRRGHRAAHRWGRPAQTGAGAGRNIPSCSTIVPRTTMRGCRAAHPSVRRERHMSRRLPIRSATRLVSAER